MTTASTELKSKIIERLTLGVSQSLGKRQGICDVTIDQKGTVDLATINHWESTHCCTLPSDIKHFYSTTNGFLLTWKVKVKDELLPVGRMEINPIASLCKLSGYSTGSDGKSGTCSLMDIDTDVFEDPDGIYPHFDSRSRIFELDSCQNLGKVCLVFRNTKQGVPAKEADYWFLDKGLSWHFIAHNFQSYFRLMITNLGLPQWQYLFTNIGISPSVQQWYSLYAPISLEPEKDAEELNNSMPGKRSTASLDLNRVFKGKDKKKPTAAAAGLANQTASTRRKAGSPQPNKAQTVRGSASAALMKAATQSLYK
ncbi:tubulin polyglutamylase complex subunit 2-like [Watersipora subatra]|uniref:tubulin polyglutamylase complex subunit 2-like n=1 Tax=Watersipora subatra TaxID=2589382 RepID=UPI00355B7C96